MTTPSNHKASAARRKRLREMEAETGKSLQNVLDSYPLEKYYCMADRLLMAFQLALDERRLDDAYVFGLRFATFSIEGLPKHCDYQRQSKGARVRNSRQVDEVLKKLDLVATRMDAEERLLEKKRKEVEEVRRRQEEEKRQEEEQKRQAKLSEKQRYADILQKQREELLARPKTEVMEKAMESKQLFEQRALEKLKLLNQKAKPHHMQQPVEPKQQGIPESQSTASSANATAKLFQASVDGSRRTDLVEISYDASLKQSNKSTRTKIAKSTQPHKQRPPSAGASAHDDATASKTSTSSPASTSDYSLIFPQVPVEKPTMTAARKQHTTNEASDAISPTEDKSSLQASVFATCNSKQPSITLSQHSVKKRSDTSLMSNSPLNKIGINQPAPATKNKKATQDNQKKVPQNWWDTSDTAVQNASKPWWQRDVPIIDTSGNSNRNAPTIATSKPSRSANVSTDLITATLTGPNMDSSPVFQPAAQPHTPKFGLFQQLSPKIASTNKEVMSSSNSISVLSSMKAPSSEGYEITMGSTTSLRVVETEPEVEPDWEESFLAKLTPQEVKTFRLLEHTIKLQESRLARLEASNERLVLRQEAKRKLQQGDRKGALHCLAKKKRINQSIDVVKNAIFNMETQIMMMESAVESREVGMIMKEASDVMASLQNGVLVGDFTDDRIDDLLGAVGQGNLDDDEEELLSELNESSDTDLTTAYESSLLSLPSAPHTEVSHGESHPLDKTAMSVKNILASLF